jgi:eukaryotic-like serine/threonine-protein kinase
MRIILDRYELTAPIASGGMGTLWEGTDLRLNRKIAVKLVHPGRHRDSAAMRRFNREARITARLGHPGVPVLYDVGTDQDELFLVMEYVAGVTIADLVSEIVPLPVPWAAAIAAQVCAVLAAAHEQSLVHRDLKPANVMIRPDGSVKVLDFGLAAALTPGEFSQVTRSGELLGTASYMAPEMAEGGKATAASDLYSLGCLLYELLTGTTVFAESDPVAEIEAHLSRQPPRTRYSRPEVPLQLDALTSDLLLKEPSARPRDASSVFARLLPFVADVPPLPGVIGSANAPNPLQLYAILQERISRRSAPRQP